MHMITPRHTHSRRRFLCAVAGTAAATILAACGEQTPTETPRPATTIAPVPTTPATAPAAAVANSMSSPPSSTMPPGAATTAPVATTGAPTVAAPTTPRTATPKGELRYSLGVHFPVTLDPTKDGLPLTFNGPAESLTRLTPQGKVEPYLAEGVTNIDPTTWRVTLRKNAKFHDGSPVDADAVIASFRRNWELQPAANLQLSKETQLAARDATTVEFRLPRPAGDFPNALASQYLIIHKQTANGSMMTGAYRPTKLTVDQELVMEAFPDHWAGPPPLAKITGRNLVDANARALALQSGEVDLLWGLPPEIAKGFGPEFEVTTAPSRRQHIVNLNLARPPFNDRAVREAMALGIDRASLNTVAFDGKGAPATGMFPPGSGVDVVPIQSTDAARARQLLDDAGWKTGGDGVRAKEGKRLVFTLYSYPQRAELTPLAVLMQAQLKPLGFEVKVQEVQNVGAQTKDGNFEAAMSSYNTLVTGDPLYYFGAAFVKGASGNIGGYSSPPLDALVEQLRTETDPAKRQALSRQGQEIVKADIPHLFLVFAPIVAAVRKGKVRGFVPHPNDIYLINNTLSVG